jgi:Flp pilus assembly protein TadG
MRCAACSPTWCSVRSRSPADAEAGTVAAEFAVAVPAVMLVLACCLGSVQLASQQVRLQDAAAVAARATARGDPVDVGRLVPGASAAIESGGELVCVTATVHGPGLFGALTLTARSCALAGGG